MERGRKVQWAVRIDRLISTSTLAIVGMQHLLASSERMLWCAHVVAASCASCGTRARESTSHKIGAPVQTPRE
eukprot:scaffold261439_cov27-Tisochrysis_lutea.AAC.1